MNNDVPAVRLYAPVVDGNPPVRMDDPRVMYDSYLPAEELFKRINDCGGTALVAFKSEKLNRGYYLGRRYISDAEFKNAREAVFSQIEAISDVTSESYPKGILDSDQRELPMRIANVTELGAIDKLRKHPNIDYIEPSCANELQLYSGFGCGEGVLTLPDDENSADPREKSTQLATGEWVPWSFRELGVVAGWDYLTSRNQRPGKGATIGIVDTGLSKSDPEFTSEFVAAKGMAPLLKFAPPLTDSFDVCDHGTRMASFAVAPENGMMIEGIAKDSFLVVERIGDGVVHFTPGRIEIGNSILFAAQNSQVVTLAWGMPFGSIAIAEQITKSQTETEAVLLAAAGTDVPFGISVFPATMENETISVSALAPKRGTSAEFTRLPANGSVWPVSYNKGVDIVGIANVDNRAGPSIGLDIGKFSKFGGSSSATAELAGIYAMAAASFFEVNARMPSRNELTARVLSFAFQGDKLTGETFASGRSAMVGMGMVNVMAALGGFMGVSVAGNRAQMAGQSFTLQAIPIGDGPFTFQWRVDGNSTVVSTSPQPTFVIASAGVTRTYSVTVKETSTGIQKTVTALVGTTPTHTRTLFGRDTIFSYASFLDGHRVNATLGADLAMPQQCTVSAVLGQEYRKNSSGQYVAFASPVSSRDSAGRGFSVTRPALWMSNQQPIPANALNIDVHAWHDGVSSIMVRPAYTVDEPNGFDCLTGDLQAAP